MENIELWNSVSDVNLKYTKRVNVPGKTAFTNIDSYELIRMATEKFGSYGKGFGIKSMAWSEKQIEDTVLLVLFQYNCLCRFEKMRIRKADSRHEFQYNCLCRFEVYQT